MEGLSFNTLKNVKTDLSNLLRAFEQKKSLRFIHFSEVWKEAKFSLLFCGKNTFRELKEFTEETFHITKEFLSPGYELPIRIGALYSLYMLYFKQPLKDPVKIRLTKIEWEELVKLVDSCKQEKQWEVYFIHMKLFINQAYHFTATKRECGFEIGYRKYFTKKYQNLFNYKSTDPIEKPLVEPGLLDTYSKLSSKYFKLKAEAVNSRDPKLVNENFVEMFKKKFEMLGKQGVNAKVQNSTQVNIKTDVQDNENSIREGRGKRRRRLKKQAAADKKKEDVASPSPKKEERSSPPKKRRRVSKQGIIARQKALVLLSKGLDGNLNPSTSAYDDFQLPELS